MKTPIKILIVAALAVVVVGAVAFKKSNSSSESHVEPSVAAASASAPVEGLAEEAPTTADTSTTNPTAAAKLPRMVDLGASKCIPCKMMKPILDELKRDYAARFVTEFIDVWENPDAGKEYGIEMIPTQIFYDAEGKERFRHVGFYGKEDILGKWSELGIVTQTPAAGN